MTRNNLMSEVERCAVLHGFRFRTGPLHGINHRLAEPPELWAEPPVLVRREGRQEGTMQYRLTVRLVSPAKHGEERETALNAMEESLSAIALSLSGHEDIAGAPAVEYTTEENTLTNRGDVSVKATLTINTRF